MSACEQLFDLQISQYRHDELSHRDILCLPVPTRVKHMALHFSKYSGHFAEALKQQNVDLLISSLVDTFIIALASANMLQINLPKALEIESAAYTSVAELGHAYSASFLDRDADIFIAALLEITILSGKMAKACESLDHLENYPSRSKTEEAIKQMVQTVLALGSKAQVDLAAMAKSRLERVETKTLRLDVNPYRIS